MSTSSASTTTVSKRSKKRAEDGWKPHANLNFGGLSDELKSPIEQLAKSKDALTTISECFDNYKSELIVFQRDFGTMQNKEDQIKDLQTTIRNMRWEQNKEVQELLDQISAMEQEKVQLSEGQANLAKLEKEREAAYQKKISDLEKKSKLQRARLHEEHQEKEKKLQNDNAETLEKLSANNKQLKLDVEHLNERLRRSMGDLEETTKDHKFVHSALLSKHHEVQSELDGLRREYAVDTRPDEFYIENFSRIFSDIRVVSSAYFTEFPKHPETKLKQFEHEYGHVHPLAELVFIGGSPDSKPLRFAMVDSLISSYLCDSLWQPFFSGDIKLQANSKSVLGEISWKLRAVSDRSESTWRALTLRGLEALVQDDVKDEHLDAVVNGMLRLLSTCADRVDASLTQKLSAIVTDAFDLWKIVERDQNRISIDREPSPDPKQQWISSYDKNSPEATSITRDKIEPMSPVCLFPKVIRRTSSSETDQFTILPGEALFEDSLLINLGRKRVHEYQEYMSSAQAKYAARNNG